MIHVATLDDPRLDDYRATADPAALRERELFVAEGRLVVRRLLDTGRFRVRSVLLTESAVESLWDCLTAHPTVPVYVIEQAVMNAVVGFNIHRGCLAIAERGAPLTIDRLSLDDLTRVMVVEGVSNPDNIGGLFRNGAAFGVEAVLLGPGCGDPLYRKAVRTSMGASLIVPFANAVPWPAVVGNLKRAGLRTVALTPSADALPLATVERFARVALLLGSEGEGLSDTALAESELRVRIPMSRRIDSLNVAAAAAVAFHHFAALDR